MNPYITKATNEAIIAALPYAAAIAKQRQEARLNAPPIPRLSAAEFSRQILGHNNWRIPLEIMEALEKPMARVAVKSCHASAKTFTAAEIVLWWTYYGGRTITTAPTDEQLKKELWGEIRKAYVTSRTNLGGRLLPVANEWYFNPSQFATGRTAQDGVSFQGIHGDKVLIVADEANGIRDDIWEAIEGIRAGGDVRLLALANPTIPHGPFYDAFTVAKEAWTTFTIDAFDTPNLAGLLKHPTSYYATEDREQELKEEILSWDEETLAYNPFPYLITRGWVKEKCIEWGLDSPMWEGRVRGQFAQQDPYSLIALKWIEAAKGSKDVLEDAGEYVGIDVAGAGSDETAMTILKDGHIEFQNGWTQPDSRGPVVKRLRECNNLKRINIDAIGVGWNFFLHVQDQFPGVLVVPVNVGENALTEKDERKFVNLKAQIYWGVREDFRLGRINGLTDAKTIAQLSGLRYEEKSDGRIAIESKKEADRKRKEPSPDRAESLILARAKVPYVKNLIGQGKSKGW